MHSDRVLPAQLLRGRAASYVYSSTSVNSAKRRWTGVFYAEFCYQRLAARKDWACSCFCDCGAAPRVSRKGFRWPAADCGNRVPRTRARAPYLKAAGKLTGHLPLEAAGLTSDKLPGIPADHRKLREKLGAAYSTTSVDIDLRPALYELVTALDAGRAPEQNVGALHKWLNDDGRVLWLCSRHIGLCRPEWNPL